MADNKSYKPLEIEYKGKRHPCRFRVASADVRATVSNIEKNHTSGIATEVRSIVAGRSADLLKMVENGEAKSEYHAAILTGIKEGRFTDEQKDLISRGKSQSVEDENERILALFFGCLDVPRTFGTEHAAEIVSDEGFSEDFKKILLTEVEFPDMEDFVAEFFRKARI